MGAIPARTARRLGSSRALIGAAVSATLASAALTLALAPANPGSPIAQPIVGANRGLAGARKARLATELHMRASALGADQRAYRVVGTGGTLQAANPAQHLRERFTSSGVFIGAGQTRLTIALRAIGPAAALHRLSPVRPTGGGNRVMYAYPGVDAWYANGPLGLEQGFNVTKAYDRGPGVLTLTLSLVDNAKLQLATNGQALTLASGSGAKLRYDGLMTTDAGGRRLASSLRLSGRVLQLRVDTHGARFPLRIDPFIQQGQKLTGGPEYIKSIECGNGCLEHEGAFGSSVAISADGNTAVVSSPGVNGETGAAWIFTRSGESWSQQGAKLTGIEAGPEARFGESVALSSDGNTALIGGPGVNGEAGAAWVFTRSGSTWAQGPKLTGGGETGAAQFGVGVALSGDGNTALIGSGLDNGRVGAVWVFTRSGSNWAQQGAKLTGAGESGTGGFGDNVALSSDGNTALVGGAVDNEGVGAAWVLTRSGESWTQQGAKLTGAGEGGKGLFGSSVALSGDGNTALIGAGNDNGGAGGAWVFTRSGSLWSQQGEKLTGAGESGESGFGRSVALSANGNTALIGGPADGEGKPVSPGSSVGAAWTFARSGSTWTQQGQKLTGGGELGEGRFGESVALSTEAGTALIGAPFDNELGAVWTFTPCTALRVQTMLLPLARPGNPYAAQLGACGGTPGYRWKRAGKLPKGMKLSKSGALTWAPSAALETNSHPLTVSVTDSEKPKKSATGTVDLQLYGTPVITGVSPSSVPEQGAPLTLKGKNLTGTEHTNFRGEGTIYGDSSTIEKVSNTSMTVKFPGCVGREEPISTTFTIELITAWDAVDRNESPPADHFTCILRPGLLSFVPNTGPPSGHTAVTITGSHFIAGATGVKFGNTPALSVDVVEARELVTEAPPGTGEVHISVTTTGGTRASEGVFTYVPPPSVSEVTPNAGPLVGKTPVVIKGANFSGATAVKFGSTAAAEFTLESPTQIKAVSPAGSGTVDVVVTTAQGGSSATSEKDHYTYVG
jgi:IPT/TIG domain